MQNGLYVATSGLLMQEQRVSVITNNISNVNTTGFKKELAVFSDYRPVDNRVPQNMIQKTHYNRVINSSVKLDDICTDFEQGHFINTDNKLDFALEDTNNFFSVETPFGLRFTRDGTFTISDTGELVTKDGFNVIDTTGAPLIVPPGTQEINVQRNGDFIVDGVTLGKLAVVNFENTDNLQKIGRNLYTAVDMLPEVPENYTILQGFLESSNVEPVMEMVRMIEALRGFETYQKVVHTYDAMNEQAAKEIGRL